MHDDAADEAPATRPEVSAAAPEPWPPGCASPAAGPPPRRVPWQEQVADEEALRALRAASPELQERWEGNDPSKWKGVEWGDGRVRELSLGGCPLKELPAQVGLLTGLTKLYLTRCSQLTALPAELGLLTGLTSLILGGCEKLTALPAELGRLTGLTTLELNGCKQLTALPAELGWLAGLTKLILYNCTQLAALPAELGQLVNLTSLDLRDCYQLTLPPGAPANAKQTYNAPPIIAAYARLLIVEPRKDTPERLHAFLLATPLAVPPFFKFILTDAAHADWLGKAVKATPDLARLTDPDGRRAIDVAHPACKQQMQAALYLLARYDVDDGGLLHRSATSAVAAADDHTDPKARPVPRALKAMQGLEQVRAELKGREGLEREHVVAVRAVYADELAVNQADGEAWQKVQDAAGMLDGMKVQIISGLSGAIKSHLFSTSKPFESDQPVATESSKQKLKRQPSAILDAASSEYKFLLVMDQADRSLKQTIDHEHIAGKDFHSVRAIAADLVRALDHLHSKGLIHGDHKPSNAVAFGGDWRLIDLDVSCKIGEPFGDKVPSSGYCPPEMARVLLKATDDQGKVNGAKLAGYVADVSYDLWSFGIVLYHLIFGRPLWPTDVNDNVKPADLRKLAAVPDAPLRRVLDAALSDGEDPNANVDLRVATVLLRKLLEPDVEKRMKHFPKGMKDVLKEPFFLGADLDAPTLEKILKGQENMMTKLDVVIKMNEEQRGELLLSRKVLIKATLEATEVLTPTTFVILDKNLPPELSPQQSKALELSLKEDGTGFDVSGDFMEAVKEAEEQFNKAKTWVDRVKTFGKGVIEGDADKVFGKVKEVLGELVTGKTMYFYLVDELTGKPVRADGYPIEITTPSDLVPKLLPLMQVGMRAMSLYNGVAGIAQMFGYPVPKVPKAWREGAQSSVEMLKQESSVEAFGTVHAAVQEGGEKQETTRGASLRELQRFFEEHDKEKGYAGLRRVGGEDGTVLWTVLKEKEVTKKLDERAKQRREEERRRDAHLSAPAEAAASAQARHQAEEISDPGNYAPGGVCDQLLGVDKLGYTIYAKALATTAREVESPSASLCVGINARWGGGKSFLWTLILDTLESLALVDTLEKLHKQARLNLPEAEFDSLREQVRLDILLPGPKAAKAAFDKAMVQLRNPESKPSGMVDEDKRRELYAMELELKEQWEKLGEPAKKWPLVEIRQLVIALTRRTLKARCWCCRPSSAWKDGYKLVAIHGLLREDDLKRDDLKAAERHAVLVAMLVVLVALLLVLLSPLMLLVGVPLLIVLELRRKSCGARRYAPTSPNDSSDGKGSGEYSDHEKRVAALLLDEAPIGEGELHQQSVSCFTMLRYAALQLAQRATRLVSRILGTLSCVPCRTSYNSLPEGADTYVTVEFNAWVYSGSDLLWASLVKALYDKVEEKLGKDVVRKHRASCPPLSGGMSPLSGELSTDSTEIKVAKRHNAMRKRRVDASLSTAGGLILAVGLYFALEQLLQASFLVILCPADSDDDAVHAFCNCTSSGDTTAEEDALALLEVAAGQESSSGDGDDPSYAGECLVALLADGGWVELIAGLLPSAFVALAPVVRFLYVSFTRVRPYLNNSQGDTILAQAKTNSRPDMKESLGFMGTVKNEVQYLYDLLRTTPMIDALGCRRKVRLCVMIDDLDRCLPNDVVKILEAVILLLADSAPITCWLAVDSRMMVTSIDKYYGDAFSKAGISGYEYLDKIVQLPFCLPNLELGKKRAYSAAS